jgi:hypothetical protein
MADKVLAGEVPPADVGNYPPGTVWMQILQREADATGKTIKVNVYSTNMATYVAASLAGPEQDGGPRVVEVRPVDWEYPPSGGAPGLVLTTDVVVAHPNFYRIEALCAGVRVHYDVQLGTPGVEQMGRDIDLELAQEKTYLGRIAKEQQKMRDVMRPTGTLGRPKSSRVRMPRRVP